MKGTVTGPMTIIIMLVVALISLAVLAPVVGELIGGQKPRENLVQFHEAFAGRALQTEMGRGLCAPGGVPQGFANISTRMIGRPPQSSGLIYIEDPTDSTYQDPFLKKEFIVEEMACSESCLCSVWFSGYGYSTEVIAVEKCISLTNLAGCMNSTGQQEVVLKGIRLNISDEFIIKDKDDNNITMLHWNEEGWGDPSYTHQLCDVTDGKVWALPHCFADRVGVNHIENYDITFRMDPAHDGYVFANAHVPKWRCVGYNSTGFPVNACTSNWDEYEDLFWSFDGCDFELRTIPSDPDTQMKCGEVTDVDTDMSGRGGPIAGCQCTLIKG